MKNYMLLYWMSPAAPENPPSPEEMQQVFGQWQAWKAKFQDAVTDMGDGLQPTGKVLVDGQLIDGPFLEAKEIVGGYSIVRAESLETAAELARACPMAFMPGSRIEIRELMGY